MTRLSGAARRREKRERLGITKSGANRRTNKDYRSLQCTLEAKRGLTKCALGTESKAMDAIKAGIEATPYGYEHKAQGKWKHYVYQEIRESDGVKTPVICGLHKRMHTKAGWTERRYRSAGTQIVMHS